ncbi:MAG: hypothetical protein WC700_04180 [Gemmatimonadaceae bacterium]|jgi:hypothetical protein
MQNSRWPPVGGAYYAPSPAQDDDEDDPLESYVTYAEQFNLDLKALTVDLHQRYPLDAKIDRAYKQIMTVINYDPLFVIDTAGPYLLTYKDQIAALRGGASEGIEQFFINNTFDDELKRGTDMEKTDLVKYIIPKAKEPYKNLTPAERKPYRERVVRLLDNYVDYLLARESQGA